MSTVDVKLLTYTGAHNNQLILYTTDYVLLKVITYRPSSNKAYTVHS